MVDKKSPDVAAKIDRIRFECLYPSDSELAKVVGVSTARFSTWRKRNTYGQEGEDLLHDATGVSIDWLRDRSEIAFPSPAKINPNLNIKALTGNVIQIRKLLMEFAYALAVTTPELALAWKKRLEDPGSQYHVDDGFHLALLAVFDSIPDTRQATSDDAHQRAAHAKSRQKAAK